MEAVQPTSVSAQVVGNAFVHQYYHILHQSPSNVYRFYQEISHLGRPDKLGDMSTVTTMEGINKMILAMNIARAEIRTVDAQESLNGGVIVLVTGNLTQKASVVAREFTQSFFLAPQEKGYFVLNDVLRYVGDTGVDNSDAPLAGTTAVQNGSSEHHLPAHDSPQQEEVTQDHSMLQRENAEANVEEVSDPSDGDGSVVEDEAPVVEVIDEPQKNPPPVVTLSSAPPPSEFVQKKSYASILKVMKDNASAPPAQPIRPAPPKQERLLAPAPAPPSAQIADVSQYNPNPEDGLIQDSEADGNSIYLRNLPLAATPEELEEEIKRFGTIKHGGVQVRSHKIQGFCYGFVEFEDASAVQRAIEASPLTIGGRQVYVEEKRAVGSRAGGRGRFPPGRGGSFRNEGARGRGSYGGRGYGRSDYNYRPEYANRGGRSGAVPRGGDVGYQRVDYSATGVGRGSRPAEE